MAYAPLTSLQGLVSSYGMLQLEFCHENLIHAKDTPTNRIPFHIQPYYELIFFVQGKRNITVGQNTYPCQPGSIICFSPNEPHCGYWEEDIRYERFVLHVYPNALLPFAQSKLMLRCFTDRPYCQSNLLSIPKQVKNQIYSLLREASLFLNKDSGVTYHLLVSVLLLIGKYCSFEKGNSYQAPSELMQDILAYIEKSPITDIETLCNQFSISASTLWRLFNEQIQMSPKKYILMRRIAASERLLQEGRTVNEAASESGFSSASHYISLFRSIYKMTPLQFQKEWFKGNRHSPSTH